MFLRRVFFASFLLLVSADSSAMEIKPFTAALNRPGF
jgi:hypothetical protein